MTFVRALARSRLIHGSLRTDFSNGIGMEGWNCGAYRRSQDAIVV